MRLTTFVALMLTVVPLSAFAQDSQLYEDPADPAAAFVRIVAPGETVAVVDAHTFDDVKGGVTPYVMMSAGPVSVEVGDLASQADIPPTSFHSFVVGTDGTLHLLQDKITNSPAQADLVFYNLSDLPTVDLFVPSVDAFALEAIAQNTSRQVTLKAPLTLGFQILDGDTVLADLPDVQMRRRAGVTVVFSGTAGSYSAFTTENLYFN